MIQRVQSLFLLGAIVCLGLTAAFPIFTTQDATTTLIVNVFEIQKIVGEKTSVLSSHIYLFVGICVAILLAGFTLLQYNNRVLQLKLNMVNNFVILGVMLAAVFIPVEAAKQALPNPIDAPFGISAILFFVSILFIRVANFFIKKDEDLVRSVDRIR
ncbi:MAG: DUF4293 domain-containing protein [Cytophagales bacterium]|nr:DUF4293 domain-containing protein [Cytophagales bacterium]